VHENVKEFMQGFRYDAHPMGMLLASVGALSTFYPEANQIKNAQLRYEQIIRLLAKMPTLAAFAYRHNRGMPYVYPDNDLSYPGNFLGMLFKIAELKYQPDPRIERALDVLFILHADHEQNCSTSAVRSVGSSQVDPYSALAAGVGARPERPSCARPFPATRCRPLRLWPKGRSRFFFVEGALRGHARPGTGADRASRPRRSRSAPVANGAGPAQNL
jgi:hypothetical protein